MAKYYAIMDKDKKYIKVDVGNGQLMIFEKDEQAYNAKDTLGYHGEHDVYVVPVPVTVTQFEPTEND